MVKRDLPRNKEGKKLYPVCSWEKNQHKLYNAHDRVMNAYTAGEIEYEYVEKIEKAMYIFDSCVIDGIVYATWEDRNLMIDYIAAYDARH